MTAVKLAIVLKGSHRCRWEHSSVSATLKNLFNLTSFLTKRDSWAGSLHELLTDEPRTDAPMHLPESPKPAIPFGPNWPPPPPPSERRGLEAEDGPEPQHCGRTEPYQGCPGEHRRSRTIFLAVRCHTNAPLCTVAGVTHVSSKQRNQIRLMARLTMAPEPPADEMTHDEANAWLSDRFLEWKAQGGPMR